MKTCPYCAEEIQAAALVCKHCHRDLVPQRPSPYWRWARGIVIALGLWLGVFLVAFYYSDDHQVFLAWQAQREAWHRKCWPADPGPTITPAMRACADERLAMLAAARRHGWDRLTVD